MSEGNTILHRKNMVGNVYSSVRKNNSWNINIQIIFYGNKWKNSTRLRLFEVTAVSEKNHANALHAESIIQVYAIHRTNYLIHRQLIPKYSSTDYNMALHTLSHL